MAEQPNAASGVRTSGEQRRTTDLQHRFEYHPPHDDATKRLHETARAVALRAAEQFEVLLPKGREKSLVFTKIEEALFWANAAIARHQDVEVAGEVLRTGTGEVAVVIPDEPSRVYVITTGEAGAAVPESVDRVFFDLDKAKAARPDVGLWQIESDAGFGRPCAWGENSDGLRVTIRAYPFQA